MEYIFTIVLLIVCYFTGSMVERKHFKHLKIREAELHDIPVLSTKRLDPSWHIAESQLVIGSVVISMDYFKRFAASLRSLFGGNLRSVEPLLDRARREALVRMREEAKRLGASLVVNVRLETSRIGMNKKGNSTGCAEMVAYGTAITLARLH